MRSGGGLSTNRRVNVIIARDGEEIGDYPREQIANLVRSGKIQPTDIYWHEGMEAWGTVADMLGLSTVRPDGGPILEPAVSSPAAPAEPALEPPPHAQDWVKIGAGVAVATLAVIGFAAFLIKPDATSLDAGTPTMGGAPVSPPLTDTEVRDKAAAQLRARIEALPSAAAPPLNTFYYDFNVDMKKMLSSRTPWVATMRGRENLINPETNETISRTEFLITAEYTDGEWRYDGYHGFVTNVTDGATTEEVRDRNSAMIPTVVGMLGLKTTDEPNARISLTN